MDGKQVKVLMSAIFLKDIFTETKTVYYGKNSKYSFII